MFFVIVLAKFIAIKQIWHYRSKMNKAKRSNQKKYFKKLRKTYHTLMEIHFKKVKMTKTARELCKRKEYSTDTNISDCAAITRNSISLGSTDNCQGDNEEFEVKTSLDEKENSTSDGWNGPILTV